MAVTKPTAGIGIVGRGVMVRMATLGLLNRTTIGQHERQVWTEITPSVYVRKVRKVSLCLSTFVDWFGQKQSFVEPAANYCWSPSPTLTIINELSYVIDYGIMVYLGVCMNLDQRTDSERISTF